MKNGSHNILFKTTYSKIKGNSHLSVSISNPNSMLLLIAIVVKHANIPRKANVDEGENT
jgi:hypothetical protein